MKFHDIEQNTEEWLQLRCGKLGGSSFGKIMANYPKSFGEQAKKLAMILAVENITKTYSRSGGFENEHTQRGHEQEPIARELYESLTFRGVERGGFYDCGFVGVSPDGRVDNGLIEIKSVVPSTHFQTIKRGSIDPAYKWQLIGNMHYTQSEFIDFVSYCADFPEEKRLFICTLGKDKVREEVEQLKERVSKFEGLVKEYIEIINSSEYEVIYE